MCEAFTGSLGMFQEIIIAQIDELVSANADNLNLSGIFKGKGNIYLDRLISITFIMNLFPRACFVSYITRVTISFSDIL